LPVYADPQATGGQVDGLTRVANWSTTQSGDLVNRLLAASARVQALNRRASVDGNALNLPLVFDAQLFQYYQMADLAFAARFRNMDQVRAAASQAMNANLKTTASVMSGDSQKLLQLQNRFSELLKELGACGDDEGCKARVNKKIDDVQTQMQQVEYEMCVHDKQSMDGTYTQAYKMWKTAWDDFRPASADFYAFTDPVIAQVWAPSLNEFLGLHRESLVMANYTPLAREAAWLADTGQHYRKLQCVPPPPPSTGNAEQPKLPPKPPSDCPFDPPKKLGGGFLKLTFACDHFTAEGGELLRGKVNRNFTTKETTLWGGVGVSAGAEIDALGPASPKAEVTAEGGAGVTFGQGGAVTDVFVSGQFSGEASMPGVGSSEASISGTWSLESGPSTNVTLPGGLGSGPMPQIGPP